MHKTAPHNEEFSAPYVNSARVEKLLSRDPGGKQNFGRHGAFLSSAKQLTVIIEDVDISYNIT